MSSFSNNSVGNLTVSGQSYGAKRVPTGFSYAIPTGAATAPSQFQVAFVGGQNLAFDANMYVQSAGSAGTKVAVSAPSGASVVLGLSGQANAPSGFNSDLFVIGNGGTTIGSGVYAIGSGTISDLTITCSITGVAGVTGPLVLGLYPAVTGQTYTVLPGSNLFVYPST